MDKMAEIMSIEDFAKIDLRIGEIKEVKENFAKISCYNKDFIVNLKLNAKKKDKIVVIVQGDKLIIPIVESSIIQPEDEIELGSRVR